MCDTSGPQQDMWENEANAVSNESGSGPAITGVTSQGDISSAVIKYDCCNIVMIGHLGGCEPGKGGGIVTRPKGGGTVPILPDPKFEGTLGALLKKNCPKGCKVTIGSCGGCPGQIAFLQGVAKRMGCTVCNTNGNLEPQHTLCKKKLGCTSPVMICSAPDGTVSYEYPDGRPALTSGPYQ